MADSPQAVPCSIATPSNRIVSHAPLSAGNRTRNVAPDNCSGHSPGRAFFSKYFIAFLLSFFSAGPAMAAMCVASPPASGESNTSDPTLLPLLTISQLQYKGSFTFPPDTFGESSTNYAEAIIEQSGDTMFIAGTANDDAIGQFRIPELVNSPNMADLNFAENIQGYSKVFNRTATGNPQTVDQIMGMEEYQGRLLVHVDYNYDAGRDNTHTTLVLSDASDLAGSDVEGFLQMRNTVRSAGWMTEMPQVWRDLVGGNILSGAATGNAIASRLSIGPTFHSVRGNDFLSATVSNPLITTRTLLEYDFQNTIRGFLEEDFYDDMYNVRRDNDLWTITTGAKFAFIVPGTRTYAVFGYSSGHNGGIGYKATQSNGNVCHGPCSFDANDIYNYYWLFDMNDLLAVQDGSIARYDPRPYEYGEFFMPYQENVHTSIAGGTFDLDTNTLYLSLLKANNSLGQFANPPIVAAFDVLDSQ